MYFYNATGDGTEPWIIASATGLQLLYRGLKIAIVDCSCQPLWGNVRFLNRNPLFPAERGAGLGPLVRGCTRAKQFVRVLLGKTLGSGDRSRGQAAASARAVLGLPRCIHHVIVFTPRTWAAQLSQIPIESQRVEQDQGAPLWRWLMPPVAVLSHFLSRKTWK